MPYPSMFVYPARPQRAQQFDSTESVLKVSSEASRPSTPTSARRLRFIDPGPSDVHVYESAPSSPKRVLGLLGPSDSSVETDPSVPTYKFQDFNARKSQRPANIGKVEDEEGTPEFIRKRYFPSEQSGAPSLDWMRSSTFSPKSSNGREETTVSPRYDLLGKPISAEKADELPTHLGLHHHADPSQRAGYTLDDLLHLGRSSVPSQRATMLTVLARILSHYGTSSSETSAPVELGQKEIDKIVAVGVEALSVRTNLGVCVAGIEVVWTALSSPTLLSAYKKQTITTLPLDYLLPSIISHLRDKVLPATTQIQLLQILEVLSSSSASLAAQVFETPDLLRTLERTFLFFDADIEEQGSEGAVLAITFFNNLARASRTNAKELIETADSLLRFLTAISSADETISGAHACLIGSTLSFYATLARYGMYSHVATTARELFVHLEDFLLRAVERSTLSHPPPSSTNALLSSYLILLEAWITCAIDPHATTPAHDILWTQVDGWGWGDWLLDVVERLSRVPARKKKDVVPLSLQWAHAVEALAAWLEGSVVNFPRQGQKERDMVQKRLEGMFGTMEWSGDEASGKKRLLATLRLSLVLRGPIGTQPLDNTPLFPTSEATKLIEGISSSTLGKVRARASCEDVEIGICCSSLLLGRYSASDLDSKAMAEWLSKAFTLLRGIKNGSEDLVEAILKASLPLLSRSFTESLGIAADDAFWSIEPLSIIVPFLLESIRISDNLFGSERPSPRSIMTIPTQVSPSEPRLIFSSAWPMIALNHLLRSGSSKIYNLLPKEWNYSETQVVQSSLFLTLAVQHLVPLEMRMNTEEAVLECMKVFMLEHEQNDDDSSSEVFRDPLVEKWMKKLISPYCYERESELPSSTLEDVAKDSLSSTIPFYQLYTDFVALYDSISFFHPLFASLLLPPLSSAYASDYRTLLFNDHTRLIKSIKTPIHQVPVNNLRSFLYPVEKDPKLVGSFVGALAGGGLAGLMQWMIVHHLACNIWPDLQLEGDEFKAENAIQLLEVVLQRCSLEDARLVVMFYQHNEGELLHPPHCTDLPPSLGRERLEWLDKVAQPTLVDRLRPLLGRQNSH
jgi:RNA polymerase II-associated protein 1